MAYQLQYFDEVGTDIREAKIWYREQKEGLEIAFANAIIKAIDKILRAPESYAIRYRNIRIAHPKVFPYNIHFYIDEPNSSIVITAIVHNKRQEVIARKRI